MKILLAGGAGYIGSHTAVELLDNGHEVTIVDNYANSSPETINRIKAITSKVPVVYEADVRDAADMRSIFAKTQADCVIHLAGLKAVGTSCAQPLEYYRNNIDATLTLLETMQEVKVKQLVFSSSATVYGSENLPPYTEGMPVGACSNPYGRTKVMAEQILEDAAGADPALSVVVLRYFNPIGAHETGLIGEEPRGVPENLMPMILQAAADEVNVVDAVDAANAADIEDTEDATPIAACAVDPAGITGKEKKLAINKRTIFGDDYETPDGTCLRDYIHVMDLAAGHLKAVEYAAGHTGVEIFNLGTGTPYSVKEIVEAFERTNDVHINLEIGQRRPGDLPVCWADTGKARRILGWTARRSLEDMCRDAWNWQCRNRMEPIV